MVKKGLTILGSTGSIGQQTLAVTRYQTELSIYALTANTAVDLLVDQCEVYHPSVAVIADPNCYGSLVTKLADVVCKPRLDQGSRVCEALQSMTRYLM